MQPTPRSTRSLPPIGRWAVLAALALFALGARHLVDAHPRVDPADSAHDSFRMADDLVDVRGHLDRSRVLAGGDGTVRLELLLNGADAPRASWPAETDFIVVFDRSGSMAGEKIAQARAATLELLERLGPRDRFALITYSSDVRLEIPLGHAVADRVREWRRRVEGIEAGGGTAMSAGLDRALELIGEPRQGPRRIVLLSDGLANEGDPSFEGLGARATSILSREAVLSAVGIGLDFDERVMTMLADRGAGNFYFLEHPSQLASLFDAELGATRETVAAALEIGFEPAPGVRFLDAAGYPMARDGGRWTFRPGPLFAGQERRLWLTLSVPPELGPQPIGRFVLAYRHGDRTRTLAADRELLVVAVADPDAALEGVDRDRWARSVVEDEYGALRQTVAVHVQEGRRQQALEAIRNYRKEKEVLNAAVASPAVATNLEEASALAEEVESAFDAADSVAERKLLSKQQQAAGWDQRRAGSKKTGDGGR